MPTAAGRPTTEGIPAATGIINKFVKRTNKNCSEVIFLYQLKFLGEYNLCG
jgi:hypothetical protein